MRKKENSKGVQSNERLFSFLSPENTWRGAVALT